MKEDHPLVKLKEYNESDKGDSDENDENVCQWILHVNKHFETVLGKILFESILSISTSTGTQKVIKILF